MKYSVESKRITSLNTDLRLLKDDQTVAKLTVQYSTDLGELILKKIELGYSAEFLRTTRKTPVQALFEFAIAKYGHFERGLIVSGDLEHALDRHTVNHYTKTGLLIPREENSWHVTGEEVKRLQAQKLF
jgi:hypothetical protein